MRVDEARLVLGLSPNCRPTPSQIKAAYKRKVLETHPDRFPLPQKPQAESQFKLVSEAYAFLLNSGRVEQRFSTTGPYSRVVKTGVPRPQGRHRNLGLASFPFILIIVGAFTLGGSTAARAYTRQKDAHPSFNPFLP